MRRLTVYVLFILLFAFTVNAAWIPSSVELVHEGTQLNVNGITVRVDTVDYDERMVYLTVRRAGETLGEGALFEGEELQIRDLLRITIDSMSPITFYGEQATLRFHTNTDGVIVYTNFPNHMSYNSQYPVFAVVKNTGPTAMEYAIELTEPGNFKRVGRVYQTEQHQVVNELLKVDRPIKFVTLAPGESARIDWLIGPNRRQSSYSDSIVKVGDVQFNLWGGDNLLDSLTLYSVKASTEQSGYISDLSVPLVMLTDVPYDAYTIVQNTGFSTTGTNSNKFGLRVNHPDFEMEPKVLYADINPWTKDELGFRLRAYEPGEYAVPFEFVLNDPFLNIETILDTFTVPIKVMEGYSTRIAEVRLPEEISLGDQFLAGLVIENLGAYRLLDLVAESPILSEQKKVTKVGLDVNSLTPMSFTFEATTYGRIPLIFTLYDKSGSKENINLDPYSPGRMVGQKTVYINVPNPSAPAREVIVEPKVPAPTVPEAPVPSEPVGTVVSPPPAPVALSPPTPVRVDTTPDTLPEGFGVERNWTYISLLIAGIIIILVILIAVVGTELNKRK